MNLAAKLSRYGETDLRCTWGVDESSLLRPDFHGNRESETSIGRGRSISAGSFRDDRRRGSVVEPSCPRTIGRCTSGLSSPAPYMKTGIERFPLSRPRSAY